jgi:hypothetical protein
MRNERELIELAKTQALEAIAKRLKRPPEFVRAKALRLGVSIRRGNTGAASVVRISSRLVKGK